jgi:EAL domain-containing protein (putative c-di-GMP-specific phosphodiesterase class I)
MSEFKLPLHSSFEHLSSLDIDYLKIDGRFIRNLEKSEKDRDIVTAIVNFSKKYGIKTIAEFVENEKILNIVKNLGVDFSQGFYIGKPTSKITFI